MTVLSARKTDYPVVTNSWDVESVMRNIALGIAAGSLLVFGLTTTALAQEPVPSVQKRRAGQRSISRVFGGDLKAAKTGFLKKTLARKLITTAIETKNDDGAKYELFLTARNLAVEAGDLGTAVEAIGECSEAFAIDSLDLQGKAAIACAKKISDPPQLDYLRSVANLATDAENYSLATKVLDAAVKASRRLDQDDRFSAFVDLRDEVKTRRKAWVAAERAAGDLKRNPNNRTACKLRGEYLCFYRNEWVDGLTLLRRMGNKGLSQIIQNEFEPQTSPDAQLAIGDAWWDWANEHIEERADYLGSARFWYERARPGLTGLHLRRVEDRLAALSDVRFPRLRLGRKDAEESGAKSLRAMTLEELASWTIETGGGCFGFTQDEKFIRLVPGKIPPGVSLRRVQIGKRYTMTDADFVRLKGYPALDQLHCFASKVRGPGLVALKDCKMTVLRLMTARATKGGGVIDEFIEPLLKQFSILRDLTIDDCSLLKPRSIELICSQPWEYLRIGHVRLRTSDIQKLKDSPRLTFFAIHNSRLSGVDLTSLADARSLVSLHLTDNELTPRQFAAIPRMTRLTTLLLRKARIGDREVAMLSGLTGLEELGLDETLITDASVPTLMKFKKLKRLGLQKTRLSRQGLVQLTRALPNCEITVR